MYRNIIQDVHVTRVTRHSRGCIVYIYAPQGGGGAGAADGGGRGEAAREEEAAAGEEAREGPGQEGRGKAAEGPGKVPPSVQTGSLRQSVPRESLVARGGGWGLAHNSPMPCHTKLVKT